MATTREGTVVSLSSTLNGGVSFNELVATSNSTNKGYVAGKILFNKFAAHQKVKKLEQISVEDCTEKGGNLVVAKLFSTFAAFLLEYKQTNGSNIKPDCQLQYLSNAVNFLRQKYSKACALKEGTEENLVSRLQMQVIANVMRVFLHIFFSLLSSTFIYPVYSGTKTYINICELEAEKKQSCEVRTCQTSGLAFIVRS